MSKDISTLAIEYVYQLFKIPSFKDLEKLVFSEAFPENITAVVNNVLKHENVSLHGPILDTQYSLLLDQALKLIDPNTSAYKYLALSKDFSSIRNSYLQQRLISDRNYFNRLDLNKSKNLRLYPIYREDLAGIESKLHSTENAFEFTSQIDVLYLKILLREVSRSSEYFKNVISAKIQSYNLMAILRLSQQGKTKEAILPFLVDGQELYSLNSIRNLSFGDLPSEIGIQLKIPLEKISVTAIETFLHEKEMKEINKALFHGVGEERIVQYFEKLRLFISNIKLGLTYKNQSSDIKEIESRLINYDIL